MGQTAFNQAQTRQDRLDRLKADQDYRARQEARQARLDERGQFQVVGGSLLDLSDPSNPEVVYEGSKPPKVSLLGGGKYIAVEEDGKVDITKSLIFDELMEQEKSLQRPTSRKPRRRSIRTLQKTIRSW